MVSNGMQGLQAAVQSLKKENVRGGSTNLCLRCGKPGATRVCEGCNLAKFCCAGCESAAQPSHSGACRTAAEVKERSQSAPAEPSDEQLDTLQSLLLLVGRHLNPLLSLEGGQADKVLLFLRHHSEIIQRQLADYLFMSCEGLQHDRVCCNPHIYTWCLLDGCLRTGEVMEFATSIGLSTDEAPDSPLSAEQAKQRYARLPRQFMDWQRTTVLPLQEMFGQVGMGRFWERDPAPPAEAGQHRSLDLGSSSSARQHLSADAGGNNGRSATFPPRGRASINFCGAPAVIAVRCETGSPPQPMRVCEPDSPGAAAAGRP